jgi:hypothetical protein
MKTKPNLLEKALWYGFCTAMITRDITLTLLGKSTDSTATTEPPEADEVQ